ncbi:MAG: alpha-amylase family glycosyl hydrolase [Spirochaetia bacterium]
MSQPKVRFSFHVSRAARTRYDFSDDLFSTSGNVVFLDLHGAQLFTQRMNEKRRQSGRPQQGLLRAGDMNAMGLIDEILHYVAGLYRQRIEPLAFSRALEFAAKRLGQEEVEAAFEKFQAEFPPVGETGSEARETTLEEMLMLSLANRNPAFAPFVELFDHAALAATAYAPLVEALGEFFESQPVFGPDDQDLVTMLRSPALAAPDSLSGQLEYIRTRWGFLLGDLLLRLLTGLDLIREEEKLRFGTFTPGPPEVYEYVGQAAEVEAFSEDRDWMPRAVMIAKNALVWLDQLSRAYGREIRRLDQIPDEELDRLARSGFTALWLIGVWERSGASREIKRRMGNPEAEASAYSLFDYEIAAELGGQGSLDNLKGRAWQRGIRLASDMVPNHTGVDSRWMTEHPERFLSWRQPWPPFPSYTFDGPNVSQTPGLGVYLEDHYWDRRDAAVVFKRVDFATGDTRLIYHGNDGTHMPWNDTAQLDFLNPETREAVIQTILHVARMFPLIRFDAAMTLAKKHYQRLWYPEPGRGGDIASRAGNGLSRHDFDRAMPVEFWREVVDRVAREAPDTLLLAEAFWMLEGFFVRTLGMHRVYNSAFMHMLKKEDNAGYRQTIRNTIEFDPEVLKRFVNFMSNPDEQTAIEQFGDGDKYFGVCTLMATLPGLPMFAHGQVEGLREKYGMEFRRAYWNEAANAGLAARHEREIFPLLRRRHIFSGVAEFLLYDFFSTGGNVNEDVFAYSNRRGNERGLVLYNNRFAEARGWVRTSAAYAVKTAEGRRLVQKCLGEGLGLPNDAAFFTVFRDHATGLQFIRGCRDLWEKGLYAELGAYRVQVFLDFSVVRDDDRGRWSGLASELSGQGVPSMDAAFRERELRPVRETLRTLLEQPASAVQTYPRFLEAATPFSAGRLDAAAARAMFEELHPRLEAAGAKEEEAGRAFLRAWTMLRPLAGAHPAGSPVPAWLAEWMLVDFLAAWLARAGWDAQTPIPALFDLLLSIPEGAVSGGRPAVSVDWLTLLSHPSAERLFGVHAFEGMQWFRKESLEMFASCVSILFRAWGRRVPKTSALLDAAGSSGYRWDELLKALPPAGSGRPPRRTRSS